MPKMEAHQFDGFVMALQLQLQNSMRMAMITTRRQIAEAEHQVQIAKMRSDHAKAQAEAAMKLHTQEVRTDG